MTSDWTWEHWLWTCLFIGGAFYMLIDIGRRTAYWLFCKVLPTRYSIPIGQHEEQVYVTVWAYSLERAIIKAAAKDALEYTLAGIGWTPMPWAWALKLNIQWLVYEEWKSRLEYGRYSQGETWELLAALIEIYGKPGRSCWANRRDLWLLSLRYAELEAQKPEEKKPEDDHANA
jgi:hypothetical protein